VVTNQNTPAEGASLRILDISKDFPSPDNEQTRTLALDHVSLSLAPGELVSLIGPSGCGKSTLLRLVAGLDVPTSGQLWVGSERINAPSAERGLVFQDPNLFPWLTVRKNIQAGLVARGLLQRKRDEVDEFMRLVGLDQFANAYPHHLSGGMAQRAALARALINHPKVLLLDEPLGALDAFTRMKMHDEVLRLWLARGTTILLVTHDIDEAIYMSDRIVILTPRPGRIERNLDVPLERPRDRSSPEFLRLHAEILEHLHFAGRTQEHEKPSVPESPAPTLPKPPEVSHGARATELASTGASISSESAPVRGTSSDLDTTVLIIGGGPAGSTVGAYLGRAGIDNIILDQAVHPRPHVGESLVCSTTRIFEDIDFLGVMEREAFVHKHGAVWTHWADQREHVIRFREIPELGLTQDYTYHVDRGRFDQLLLQHAARHGTRVIEGARVERVEFDRSGTATGVRAKINGEYRSLRCRLVVDASGRSTVVGSQLRLKHHDALFDQFAVHNWFEGVDRGPAETADFIHIQVLAMPRAWVWLIPINQKITSVGIVTRGHDFPKGNESVKDFFARHIASQPLLAQRMANARPLHAYVREGNYSYVMEQFTGPGWLLVGDAARFVDPVFSSGVSVAMESAKRASSAIIAALSKDNPGPSDFAEYESSIRAGVDIWRSFILLYYQLPPLFFDVLSKPEGRRQLTRLLQGDVYDRASVPILEEMHRAVQNVAADQNHPWFAQLSPELLDVAAGHSPNAIRNEHN
jgi:ABC-type nitrate/sulfonate/bicarbonate transport system ATPase subunit/flavin-dependent dehydrogenase